MTAIVSSRRKLDSALATEGLTILLLSGTATTDAKAVHDKAEDKVREPWRKVFWIKDLGQLTATEKQGWFDAEERYVVLGGDDKRVAVSGDVGALLLDNGKPSSLRIRQAFAKGDALG